MKSRKNRFLAVFAAVAVGAGLVSCAPPIAPKQSLEDLMQLGVPEEYSTLDNPGVEKIREDQAMRFDLRDLALRRAELGHPDGKLWAAVGGPSNPDMLFVVDGPDGQLVTSTRTMMLSVEGRKGFDGITLFREFEGLDEGVADLLDPKWGLNYDRVDKWRISMGEYGHETKNRPVSVGGSPAGVVISTTAKVREDQSVLITYDILLDDYFYSPEVMASIIVHGAISPR